MSYQKEQKREQILDQGVQLLMRNGYHGTGIKLLLDKVNVPKGSFYSYFESKEKFTAEAISHYIEPFISKLEHYLNESGLDGYSAINQYFADLMRTLDESDYEDGCLLGDLMGEIGSCSELCRFALKRAIERYCGLLEKGLTSAQQQGLVRSDISAATMASVIFDCWQGALLNMKVEQSTMPLQRFSNEILKQYITK